MGVDIRRAMSDPSPHTVNRFVCAKKRATYVRMIRDVTLGFFECKADACVPLLSCVGSVATMDGDSGICDSVAPMWS
jgi:hypothetical protein